MEKTILVPVPLWKIRLQAPDPVLLQSELERTVAVKRAESVLRTREEKALKRATPKRSPSRQRTRTGRRRLQVLVDLSSKDGITDLSLSLAGKQREREGRTGVSERQVLLNKV
jgi:hypothetical protein